MRLTRRDFLTSSLALAATPLLARRSYAEASFTFAQLGDTQLGFGGYEHDVATFRQAVKELNVAKPDFVVICGDLINDTNNDQAFADFNAIKSSFEMPCHCVPGNHDVSNTPTPALLERYRKTVGKDWYAFQHKGFTFAAVNTQLWKAPLEGETGKQDAWLAKTLADAKKRESPVIIAGHYPLYAGAPDEEEGYYSLAPAKRKELIRLYKDNGVAAVLSGHMHKNVIHDLDGIQLVTTATTSKNFDNAPMGYRIWTITGGPPYPHAYTPLSSAPA